MKPPSTPSFSRRELFAIAGTAGVALALPAAGLSIRAAAAQDSSAASQPPGFYRFKIGGLNAIALSDGQAAISPIRDILAPDLSPEQVDAALAEAFHPRDHAPMQFNILLVQIGSDWVLFDAGNGAGPGSMGGKLISSMEAAGLKPAQITAIVISHCHPDHINGLLDTAGKPLFTNARYFINRSEHVFWSSPAAALPGARIPEEWKKAWIEGAAKTLATITDKTEKVAPGDRILNGVELIDAAGHTPGHMSAIIHDGDAQVVAMADLAHNYVLMIGNPDSSPAFDADPKAAAATRRKLFDRFAADRARIFGYHMPWPGLGHLRRKGNGFEWAIEPWSWS